MLDRMAAGELPKKPHTVLRAADGALRYEQCLTRAGFDGPFSMLYLQSAPQAWTFLEAAPLAAKSGAVADEPLRRRHYRTAALAADAHSDLLESPDILLSIAKPTRTGDHYVLNADADALWFVRQGRGTLRSPFGDLAFETNDYVCIPKGVLHRLIVEAPLDALVIECRGGVGIPAQFRNPVGQLRMDAPYSHRDFRRPVFTGPRDEGLREIVVKRAGRAHRYVARTTPLDAVGWDGTVYPWAFPILAFQPRVSSVHLPPTWHGTFAAHGALICSFVPRPLDFHPDAIPCPYPHASVDIDEVLYYVQGQFGSRTGVESGSITLHPRGVAHGPQPGRYEKSLGATRTDELAVMLDCALPLTPCAAAPAIEDTKYDDSFTGG
jgi:homogentisate 1,2-dioxygenase